MDIVAPLPANEAARLHIIQHLDGLVPKTMDVVEDHHLGVITDVVRSRHGEHLVEGADATGQCDADIRLGEHQFLAVGEIVARDLHIEAVGPLPCSDEHLRDDANELPAALMHRLTHTAHESAVLTAVDEHVTIGAYPMTKLLCRSEITLVDMVVGRTKYCYLHGINYYSCKDNNNYHLFLV